MVCWESSLHLRLAFCSLLLRFAFSSGTGYTGQGVCISSASISKPHALPCRTRTPSQIDDPHLSVPRPALMTGSWHQRQNGPNRPPLFPHHAPHALPPTPSAALTWGGPLPLQSPGRLAHKRARAREVVSARPPWRCNPGVASLSSCASPADLLLFAQGRCSYCRTGIHIQIAHRHQSTCKLPLAHDPWHKRPGCHCLCRYCEVPSWS